jgi:hypothetical protein
MPVLMQAMKQNASTPQGAEGLLSALNSKHDGSILDNLGGLFGGGVDANVMDDGGKILGHVLGGKQQHVESALSQKAGIDAGSVANILKVAAPILMGILGKQSKKTTSERLWRIGKFTRWFTWRQLCTTRTKLFRINSGCRW